ncbi:myosin-2 [Abrus precatorius]|uniref:Myosin-2 n=1 Tax=Abrus precatorius TaxID=3816 RepID=A0A8B8MEZ4_ABRPR|nr:myosin-2 [Abrus precatorius]
MAKKKLSHQSHSKPQTETPPMATATDDIDPSVQIQNLKNLNSVLLKETTHRRQQIESLQLALHRSAIASDDNLAVDLQNDVLLVFVESQVKEVALRFLGDKNQREYEVAALKRQVHDLASQVHNDKRSLSVLTQERDQLKNDVVAESKRLEETASRERKLLEEAEKLRLEGDKLMEEVSEKERVIVEHKKDRDLAVRESQESLKVIEKLKEEIVRVSREKSETVKLNSAQELKINGLELELKQLSESLRNSRNEEGFMRDKVLQLEGNLGIAMQKEEEMAMEMSALLREKKEVEKCVEMLKEEKDAVNKVLGMVQKELEEKQHELDEAIRVRSEVEHVKVNRENEIVVLKGEVDRLRGVVDKLKEQCRKFEEENKELLSQVNHYKNDVDEMVLEKDSIRKGFEEEKKKVGNLELRVAEAEGMIERSVAELEEMKSVGEKHIEKITMLEHRVDVLMKEKSALQGSLVEAQRESDDLRAKVELWCTNSSKALAKLKGTAALVCQYKDRGEEVVSNEKLVEGEIQPYVEELDAIKKAFKSKNEMVDDMKQQVVLMKKTVAEAHKSKSLWTAISSATTIFAAALAAYVARGR